MVIDNYAALVVDGRAGEWSEAMLRGVLGEFDLHPLDLPDNVWEHDYAVAYDIERHNHWEIMVPIWTKEEEYSDFTLELTIHETNGDIKPVIKEFHIL
jgi:hypothetical protein